MCFSLECLERTCYQYPASPISLCLNCRRVTYKYKPTWKYFVGKLLLLRCYLMKAESCARSVLESHFTPCPWRSFDASLLRERSKIRGWNSRDQAQLPASPLFHVVTKTTFHFNSWNHSCQRVIIYSVFKMYCIEHLSGNSNPKNFLSLDQRQVTKTN